MLERMIQAVEAASIRRDQDLAQALTELRSRSSPSHEITSQLKELLAQTYDSANTYANTVVIAGYAAEFALWQLSKDLLPRPIMLWVGCLVSVSLLFFGAFEVSKMIREAVFFRQVQRVLSSVLDPHEQLRGWQRAHIEFSVSQSRRWLFFLLPTVITAFAAGVLLLSTFILNLFK